MDLERIRRANQHLTGFVTDVLNFARLDAGQVELDVADVDLADVVGDVYTGAAVNSVASGAPQALR
ncbi:hypothetical protein BH11GEM2_BH11GEM2_24690 [soil metagenome]